ncbi:rhomboid family intramembrane serine protease [Actinocorallia herbida]|uniref:rhomboid family intramembrane serine protease n=1 Tax=Actinocorallia herbida TaxID=58109 RepID=UPI001FE54C1F|nr:rhomboid family intramembrane serine protease [Actinocorallia herbida]
MRCTRCDRPICPDCMIPASVGFQCPECVREGNRDVRQATGRFGGEVATRPLLTWGLIAVNVAVFLLEYASNGVDRFERAFSLWPYYVAVDGDYYRLVTSAFLHYGLPHLALNMWALWAVGQALELSLGRIRFATLYALSALGGAVLVYWASPILTPTAGASGAIFGLFGAIFVVSRRLRMDIRPIALVIVVNLVFTFLPGFNISWQGHIGGLITGAVVAAVYVYAPRAKQTLIQAVFSVLLLVAFVALIYARTAYLV